MKRTLLACLAVAWVASSGARAEEGMWTFDGLPLDAWIGFLADAPGKTTRLEQRSLGRAEQQRVLEVGACFGCHEPEKNRSLYTDWKTNRQHLTPACQVPP